jgi:hypothetical protein
MTSAAGSLSPSRRANHCLTGRPRHRLRRPAQDRTRRPHRRHHNRVRTGAIDKTRCVTLRHARWLYHIGIGRTCVRTHVLLLVQDVHIRVMNAVTGACSAKSPSIPSGTTSPPDSHPAHRPEHHTGPRHANNTGP